MPGFIVNGRSEAAVEQVWKLLFDPSRFPEWWEGVETVRTDGPGAYTQWPTGYPDFPMPQLVRTDRTTGRVTVSCQVSDIDIAWRLVPDGPGTAIEVRVELPEVEAHRAAPLRAVLTRSIATLSAVAERS